MVLDLFGDNKEPEKPEKHEGSGKPYNYIFVTVPIKQKILCHVCVSSWLSDKSTLNKLISTTKDRNPSIATIVAVNLLLSKT